MLSSHHLQRGRLSFRSLVVCRVVSDCTERDAAAIVSCRVLGVVHPTALASWGRQSQSHATLDVAAMSFLQRHCNWQQGPLFSPRSENRRESCSSGLACLEYEEQLSIAMQRSFALLTHAHARAADAGRVLQALPLFEVFRGGGRAALVDLIAPWLRHNTRST